MKKIFKHIKLYYEKCKKKSEIRKLCKKYHIRNYTFNKDLSIDVNGGVNLSGRVLFEIPIKFNKVTDYFYCSSNYLTNLKNAPKYVGGDFFCHDNNINTIIDAPKYVGKEFACYDNNIKSLEGCPITSGRIHLFNNPVETLIGYIRTDQNYIIELFNDCDIVRDNDVIYDRLKYFIEETNTCSFDHRFIDNIHNDYNIIR